MVMTEVTWYHLNIQSMVACSHCSAFFAMSRTLKTDLGVGQISVLVQYSSYILLCHRAACHLDENVGYIAVTAIFIMWFDIIRPTK